MSEFFSPSQCWIGATCCIQSVTLPQILNTSLIKKRKTGALEDTLKHFQVEEGNKIIKKSDEILQAAVITPATDIKHYFILYSRIHNVDF